MDKIKLVVLTSMHLVILSLKHPIQFSLSQTV